MFFRQSVLYFAMFPPHCMKQLQGSRCHLLVLSQFGWRHKLISKFSSHPLYTTSQI